MKYEKLSREIIEAVGGKDNIATLQHCMTRLRMTFKDVSKVDEAKLESIDGVISLVKKGGQHQVVIGTHVHDVYLSVCQLAGIKEEGETEKPKKKGIVNSVIGVIVGCIGPLIPILVGCGLGKCILLFISMMGWADASTSFTYSIFSLAFDAGYSFLPVFTAIAAAKYFKCSPYLAAVLGCALVHPNYTALTSVIPQEIGKMFSLIPVYGVSYGSSFLPAIFIVFVMSKIQFFLEKKTPELVKSIIVPLGTLVIMIPLTFTILGPIVGIISIYFGKVLLWFYNSFGMIGLAVLCMAYPWIVACGMHAPLAVAGMQLLSTAGYDPFSRTLTLTANMAQGAASLAVGLKTKNKEYRSTCMSASFTAFFGGITEPAIYGVSMRLKKPMIAVTIGSTVAGLYAGFVGLKAYAFMSASLINFPMWMGGEGSGNLINAFITIAISVIVTFVATWLLGFEDPVEQKQETAEITHAYKTLNSPAAGQVMGLEEVNDDAFSSEALGKGVAIIPSDGKIYAPADGLVTATFETKHAIGLTTDSGTELLIHIGIDTVKLEGKPFTQHVAKGDHVKKGDLLIECDLDEIKAASLDPTTMLVVTNSSDYLEIVPAKPGKISQNDPVLTLI